MIERVGEFDTEGAGHTSGVFGEKEQSSRKRGPAPRWQQQIEAVSHLPKAQQRFVVQMLDTVLTQAASR
ncbi:MAG: hypothetical protein A2Z01_01350 [Betaproteobacteria bacterium RBG_16_58_11]|nr:MAG: hypothetical protein A2Z01_01350 [Betaproteobacteria bacterium RBG_16_58_11]OGA00347.1 MAG: hypothetical protein A2Z44_09545 [Betaproteobacteria bacterium RBG_19FT_COMBO_58_11]